MVNTLRYKFSVVCLVISSTLLAQEKRQDSTLIWPSSHQIEITKDITIADYFPFMDALVKIGDSVLNYPISEHILIRYNPWVIDTLANTDYYRMIEKDSFVYDQRKLIVLPKGAVLKIPDSTTTCEILKDFEQTRIEVNIPEYRLRIFRDTVLLYSFPVRIGQHRILYLAMGNRETDLRTKRGIGAIIKHVKNPNFYNPVDGKQFYLTKRDDEKTTVMPQIPWIETEINGIRNGQMIHPTTNPITLEKAYSNGCIGTSEADAWVIYYYAPPGTRIEIKYELTPNYLNKKNTLLKDVYGYED